MDPPCGNPGCCCNDELFTRSVEFEDNCPGRFIPGVVGAECLLNDPFEPPCRPFHCEGILYAPSNSDNPTWRAELAAITGGPVDYWDARVSTPTIEELFPYCAVFTWCNWAYADKFAMGDVLADYVDGGGQVIMGQWCFDVTGGMQGLQGRIMMPEYCPAMATSYGVGTYAGDGIDCIHTTGPVTGYASNYVDRLVPHAGAEWDGTIAEGGTPAVVWRSDKLVYYSAGNTGGTLTTGDTAQLVANVLFCIAERRGACCEPLSGVCVDNVAESQCQQPLRFYPNGICSAIQPACGEDCDGDGIHDFEQPEYTDTALFLDQLLAETQDPVYTCMFDCNEDAALDGQDIQGFVNRLVTVP